MRIVYLHQYFRTPSQSGGTRSYEMARRFVEAGHEVVMVTSDQDPAAGRGWRTWEIDGITVVSLAVPYDNTMSFARRLWAFFHFALLAGPKAWSLRPDVVLATSTPLTIIVPAVVAARGRRKPLVFEVRDLWPETPIALGALGNPVLRWLARRLERFAYRSSQRVVALSPDMADGVVDAGYPRERIRVIPNSSDVQDFAVDPAVGAAWRSGLPWPAEDPIVLYGGTLGHVNSVGWLAELAARTMDQSPIRYLVVGAGVEAPLIEARARELGVWEKNFLMRPPVPKREMPALLSASSVSCSLVAPLPALEANSANKVFDTFAAGRPVMINHRGWLAELIESSGAGLVLPHGDLDEAARLLVDFLGSSEATTSAARAAGELGRTTFDRDALAQELLDVLVSAAESRP
ncbi:hypothetical protein ASD11_11325 [Aeromicrobium sp. Root495]|uniref:glycosyltransferase family 4 protein n=1 Tax=Aeromicrobium sp. Root495 TaxID=1736550 RepID=UPI0007007DE7|nr:glycosyltransferase family 4 protein [Aeromicrobium sp. Root495]KQY60079.1 hypothetical protein ASD11_11325 [Aeromicrobium sp. Root495]